MTSKKTPATLLNDARMLDHAQLRALFDNSNEHGMCLVDKTGMILNWNHSLKTIFGFNPGEMIGQSFDRKCFEVDVSQNFTQLIQKSREHEGVFSERKCIKKDGSYFWGTTHITPVKHFMGRHSLFVCITQDVTKRHESDQKRDEYISIASHELKNPLATLSLYSDLLAKRLELDHDKKSLVLLQDIQSQTSRLTTLVDDLLTVNKIDGGTLDLHFEIFPFHEFIKSILCRFSKQCTTHTIALATHPKVLIRADKGRINQVLINLLMNAVTYSPQGSTINVSATTDGKKLTVSVSNSGQGITSSDQKNIFDRFYRTDAARNHVVTGSGLGLYISKAITRSHRCRMWVKSSPKKGTTFFFTLPISSPPAANI
jgi:PAS domain S-box-containing protein